MPANTTELEKRLWGAADEFRANSKLKSSEYSVPVLGLIFLRYADHKFTQAKAKFTSQGSGRRTIGKADYQAKGVLYLPEAARFSTLLNLPEGADIGKAINDAMKAIEADNEDLKDVLPRTYNRLDKELLVSLLKNFAAVPMDIEGDAFGKIYEYFLGKFAMSEGQKGGRVLHANQHRQADRGNHRAIPRTDLRSCVRIWRHVCSVGGVRRSPQEIRHRHFNLWPGESCGDHPALQNESCRSRSCWATR
jgi:hypothetical protein